ncbi:UDP-N-acetylmuramoyl-L-alanyl-D-glutamate--2,6-diaminopimelate ligase [Alteromonadaceae bacterium M269]|nr:UDP-N-acetylmuramoyl-L-alanyl-D-glutamate--2,6-diaminopimelate ligase [Alteromonadaceae bacterium M269]
MNALTSEKTVGMSVRTLLLPFGINAPDVSVQALILDSREVVIHSAFLAVKGHDRDGRDFIPQAISLGAHVIIADADEHSQHGHVEMRDHSVIVHFYELSKSLSALADSFFNSPSSKMNTVAVTGTNGKTSTTQLVQQIAELDNKIAASVGTLGASCQGVQTETINTTPDAISMQKLMYGFAEQGAELVALEASSHALVQGRLDAINTNVAIFTNLTRDHLDYHGTLEEYARAKRLLLQKPGLEWVVVNQEDAEHLNWLRSLYSHQKAVVVGLDKPTQEGVRFCIAKDIRYLDKGVSFTLESSWGSTPLECQLLGEFNVLNLLCAIASHLCLGMSIDKVSTIVPLLRGIPGRMETLKDSENIHLVIDYAHTPDALENALSTLRLHHKKQLWCVFGCGGERDQGKRPLMGSIAERLADQVVLTNDNSRSEDPQSIVRDILAGCQEPEHICVELDRKKAIRYARKHANANDVVLVAGKGHEDYQLVDNKRLDYNERHFIRQLVEEIAQ